MSRNIFLDKNQFVPKPKRNAYDKSKLVNGTYKAGYIYPIDVEEVTFGDSVKLDLTAALRTMPMIWPIQTPVIAKFYSFYVRYRTIHKNYADQRFNNKPANFPFLALPSSADFFKTGELGDHLGIPTTYASTNIHRNVFLTDPFNYSPSRPIPLYYYTSSGSSPLGRPLSSVVSIIPSETSKNGGYVFFKPRLSKLSYGSKIYIKADQLFNLLDVDVNDLIESEKLYLSLTCFTGIADPLLSNYFAASILLTRDNSSFDDTTSILMVDLKLGNVSAVSSVTDTSHGFKGVIDNLISNQSSTDYPLSYDSFMVGLIASNSLTSNPFLSTSFSPSYPSVGYFDLGAGIAELSDVANPFSGGSPEIPLCAYWPRAYEMCYRYYFQDLINEPFILDGEPQYNRFITNDGDGADTTDYKLFRRNWEADFLTSAKPSPQQGMAPLVGLTSDGTVTLVNSQGNTYSVQVTTDSGDVINGINFATEKGESDYSVRRTLLELATTGFTINSLRNTNAFQQWLEANYRRGLKLKDQVLSNFGVNLEYKELDVPEFLGGFSVPLNVDQIAQTSSSVEGSPLGDLAGNGALFGRQKHSITHYCDEEGCIMTLMCITPIPVYSQLLNRCWLKSTPVDFYNPSFGKIGQQPITYEEVCPIQAYNEGVDVHNVFGYQRPWYHMISSVDEVHGKMRNDMSGFLMQRIFGSTPELGASFLHIDEEQMNDVFVARAGVTDTYYGQIGVKKYKKTCIPRYALPALS